MDQTLAEVLDPIIPFSVNYQYAETETKVFAASFEGIWYTFRGDNSLKKCFVPLLNRGLL